MRITCSFHRINFGFMTPGPAPRRPVRVASRACQPIGRGRTVKALYRTYGRAARCLCPFVPPSQARRGAERQWHSGAAGRWGPPPAREAGIRGTAWSRHGTASRGSPGRGRARHAGAGHGQQDVASAPHGTPIGVPATPARACVASALCSIGRWGWGLVVRSDRERDVTGR